MNPESSVVQATIPEYLESTERMFFPQIITSNKDSKFSCMIRALITLSTLDAACSKCNKINCFECALAFLFQEYKAKSSEISLPELLFIENDENWEILDCHEIMHLLFSALHLKNTDKSSKICRPKCALHQNFPIIYQEISCECGMFRGNASDAFLFNFVLPIKKLIKNKSSSIDTFMESFDPGMLIRYSVAKAQLHTFKQLFAKLINEQISLDPVNCINLQCTKVPQRTIKLRSEAKLCTILLNYAEIEPTSFNILQVFTFIEGKLDLGEYCSKPTNPLFLKTLVLESESRELLVISRFENYWYEVKNGSCNRIADGQWIDVGLYMVWHRVYPSLIFYEHSTEVPNFKLSVFEIAYLEKLCYMCEIYDRSYESIQGILIFMKSTELENRNIPQACANCEKIKYQGEECKSCGFIEGDWSCPGCGVNNSDMYWTCEGCDGDRMPAVTHFKCPVCRRISNNVTYCKHCYGANCGVCEKEIYSYASLYCIECLKFTRSSDHSEFQDHQILCVKCYKTAF